MPRAPRRAHGAHPQRLLSKWNLGNGRPRPENQNWVLNVGSARGHPGGGSHLLVRHLTCALLLAQAKPDIFDGLHAQWQDSVGADDSDMGVVRQLAAAGEDESAAFIVDIGESEAPGCKGACYLGGPTEQNVGKMWDLHINPSLSRYSAFEAV